MILNWKVERSCVLHTAKEKDEGREKLHENVIYSLCEPYFSSLHKLDGEKAHEREGRGQGQNWIMNDDTFYFLTCVIS